MIGYSLESDKIIKILERDNEAEIGKIISKMIAEDKVSPAKEAMREGIAYYEIENTSISNKKFNMAVIANEEVELDTPNNQRKHGFFRIVVDQKVGFIKTPTFQSENETASETIRKALENDEFPDLLNDWERGATIKGVEYLHPYISPTGELEFVIFPATQIIPIYDTRFEKNLVGALRYYEYILDQNGTKKTLHYVEIYGPNDVEFWEEYDEGKFRRTSIEPHFTISNSKNGESGGAWGIPPIIPLYNNTGKTSDLKLGRDSLDDYDLHKSVMSNELEEIQEALLHIQGMSVSGENQDEIRKEWAKVKKNIKTLKMIITDDPDAKVESIKNDIPTQAKDSILDRNRSEIFTLFMAVDPNQVGDGNITNIVLKARYLLLDMKSNLMIAKLKKAVRKLLWFLNEYNTLTKNGEKFDPKEIEITVDKNILINEAEVIQNLNLSVDTMSLESRVARHPYVTDPESELERLKEEEKKNAELFTQPPAFNNQQDDDEEEE